MALMLNNLNGC